MKILVTGAAGFIGSYVSRALIWRGDNVVGIDNFNDYYPRNCKDFNVDLIRMAANLNPQTYELKEVTSVYAKIESYRNRALDTQNGTFKFYEGDITDFEILKKIFKKEKIDTVVHLAAMAGVPYSTKNPRIYASVNVDGTTNLLTLSKDNAIKRFVFASSSSVYGNREDKKVSEEDNVMQAVSIYGASKVAGEVICHAFNVIFGIPIVIDRIFGPIYGPLQRPYGMFHQRAINYAHNNKTITIYGKKGLETAKDSTYIDDQVDGILKCLDSDYPFEVFNIGTSDPKPIKIWIDTIEKAFNKKLNLEVVDADKADVVSSANITKARKMLNYSPKADMYEGVKRQVEVFKLMPAWYQSMENV
jgi:UDP-glucuronate 4-epimerase